MIAVKEIQDKNDQDAACAIREKVFVQEQNVPQEEEYDDFEDQSRHYLATYAGVPCGAARWRKTENGIKLERFAVLREFRNKEVGGHILKLVLEDVKAAYPELPVYLHAQLTAVNFYAQRGFVKEGDIFSECDIKHYKMVLRA